MTEQDDTEQPRPEVVILPDGTIWALPDGTIWALTPAMVELLAKAFAASAEVVRTWQAYKQVRMGTSEQALQETRSEYHMASDANYMAWSDVREAALKQVRQALAEQVTP